MSHQRLDSSNRGWEDNHRRGHSAATFEISPTRTCVFLVDRINLVDQTENKFDGLRCQSCRARTRTMTGWPTSPSRRCRRWNLGSIWIVSDLRSSSLMNATSSRLYADLPQRHGSALIWHDRYATAPINGHLYETVVQDLYPELINDGYLVQPRYYVPAEPTSPASRR